MRKKSIFTTGLLFLCLTAFISYGQNSVLSEGTWYKIQVIDYGIYQITYEDLMDLGVDPSSINPKHIRIYGNGNGMLPEDPEAFRYDDLVENSIFVIGEGDESFDPEDYILFYGEGIMDWNFNAADETFKQEMNLYSEAVIYFLNFDTGPGKRIESQYSTIVPYNYSTSIFNDYYAHEMDMVNLIQSGKHWYGENFGETLIYEYDIYFPKLVPGTEVFFETAVAARSFETSSFSFFVDEQSFLDLNVVGVNPTSLVFGRKKEGSALINLNTENINLKIQYNPAGDSSRAWLDYFRFNFMREMNFDLGMFRFRDVSSVEPSNVTLFQIFGADTNNVVWNISDPLNPKQIVGELNAGIFEFTLETDSLLEFIGFGPDYLDVEFDGLVENQNLHGINPVDMVIVTHSDYESDANQLASFKEANENLDTYVTTPDKIYNEFSSGKQDVTAIRDFMFYLVENSDPGQKPKYLLLFGDASYDYKDRIENNTNFIPVWESQESLNMVTSYCTDDYFGLLDNFVTLGIGRLPARTQAEAHDAVQKIIQYTTSSDKNGSWNTRISLIADDEDGNIHFNHVEDHFLLFNNSEHYWDIHKIYLDAFPQDTLDNGQQVYPLVNDDITEQVNKGVLILQYTGHGNYNHLAQENILSATDVAQWTNENAYPFMTNATSDLGKFDDPAINSLAKHMLFLQDRGLIALQAPVRLTYAGANFQFQNIWFMKLLDNPFMRLGDLIMETKNSSVGGIVNDAKHHLFGDPSLRLNIPEYNVDLLTINGVEHALFNDTLHPGQKVILTGKVVDEAGNHLSNFNGDIDLALFETGIIQTTLANDPNSYPADFSVEDSLLFEGFASVTGGFFELEFFMPLNMGQEIREIRLGMYAKDELRDAAGQKKGIHAGGQPSSVPEHEQVDVSVYPSISSGIVNIKANSNYSSLKIYVLDVVGRIYFQDNIAGITRNEKIRIDLANLNPGCYLIRIFADNQVDHFKVIKR